MSGVAKSNLSRASGEAKAEIEPKRETKRIRRSADEARRLILDAAEERLAAQGPEGIRLQDIARDVGISHPAILHHFESREGLVRALIARTSTQLRDKMLTALQSKHNGEDVVEANELISNVFETLSDRGTARLLSWMLLTGRSPENTTSGALVTEIADELHQRRKEDAVKHDKSAPDREDTLFMAILTANAAFGDAIIGRELAKDAGLDQAGVARFRAWFAKLLHDHAGEVKKI
ncbi:MAG: TetR/AcrR family transcriptional regulator [Parvibaculum sp.]|uniref:TetR/AcrR family transcriptional regulator n=1 Tax=Parvibaculum sp. TaxID=2024848 RepID=UPI0025EE481A|nr:TetR/AcrR family transcriptional regulator [Parvibaculum sp.]MCE9651137.1 TetR/AcrR family transcriptional regulator [Parvibaculum sp.]